MKFNENLSEGSGAMERSPIERYITYHMTLKCGPVTLTLSLGSLVIFSVHRFTKRNI